MILILYPSVSKSLELVKEKECIARLIVQTKMTMRYLTENIMRCNIILMEGQTKYLDSSQPRTMIQNGNGIRNYDVCTEVSNTLNKFMVECETY